MMPDIQVGPLSGVLLWTVIGLLLVGLVFAPTLGGFMVWGLAIILVALVLYFLVRRFVGRLAGRRGRAKR